MIPVLSLEKYITHKATFTFAHSPDISLYLNWKNECMWVELHTTSDGPNPGYPSSLYRWEPEER